ncbi:MATE family efflux transporter [Flaviaesturariibacter terrae]
MLARILRKFRGSDFSKNTLIIMMGTVFAQFLLIAATPVLSRIYMPAEFGLSGVFIASAYILQYLFTLKYPFAIMVGEDEQKSYRVVQLCLWLCAAFTVVLTIVFYLLSGPLLRMLHLTELGNYLLLLPLFSGVLAANETLFAWMNRNKAYRYISINRIVTASVTLVCMLLWAVLIDHSAKGLILGTGLGQLIGTGLLFYRSQGYARFPLRPNWAALRSVAHEYRSFPIYTLPSEMINIVTNQLPVFMLKRFLPTATEAGYFSMTNRVLGIPLTFVSSSISEVFRQRAADDYRINGSCRPIFLKTAGTLAAAGIVPFLVLFFFGPQLFSFVLGKEWTEAGHYAQLLAPLFCLKFIVSPMTITFFIAQKQRVDFFIHIAMLFLTALPFYIGFLVYHSIFYSLLGYSLSYSLIYLPYFYLSLKFATQKRLVAARPVPEAAPEVVG